MLVIIAPLITAPYVARVLGVTGTSIANYVYSIVTYFVLFGTVGSTLFGQREIAYYQDDPVKRTSVFKEILVFRIITVAISTVIYFFTVTTGNYSVVSKLFMIELIATAFDISWFFQGMEDFKKIVIRNFIVKLIGIALIFLLVKSENDVNKYVLCLTLPTLVGNISLWAYLPKYLTKSTFSWKSLVGYIKPLLLLFIPQIAMEVYTVLDKTMLGALSVNIDSVGYYTYSQHIVKAILQLITSLGVVMLPAMANAVAKKDTEKISSMMKNSFRFVFVLGVPMMFGIAAVANNLVDWFYGEGYEPVGPLIMVISPIILLIGLSTVTGRQYLLPTKKQGMFTVSVSVGAAINFILNFLLIPKYNAIGASIATVIAEFFVSFTQLFFVRKELPLKKYFKENVKYILFGVLMFAGAYSIGLFCKGFLGTILQISIGVVIYAGLLLLSKDAFVFEFVQKIFKKNKNKE